MKKFFLITFAIFLAIAVFFRIFCGIFVIQPIGAVPKGATILYWRTGIDIDLSFIESADGLLLKSGNGVSLLGRGMILGLIAEPITKNEILRFGYSETLYMWSTGGMKFEN